MNDTTQQIDIAVSSLTYAIKGQHLLERYGYIAWAGRDHQRSSGCGYQLSVKYKDEQQKKRAFEILRENGIKLKENGESGGGQS